MRLIILFKNAIIVYLKNSNCIVDNFQKWLIKYRIIIPEHNTSSITGLRPHTSDIVLVQKKKDADA